MSEPKIRPNHARTWLLLWVATGISCAPTDNVVGATRGVQLSGVAAGNAGDIAGGGAPVRGVGKAAWLARCRPDNPGLAVSSVRLLRPAAPLAPVARRQATVELPRLHLTS